MSRKSSLQVAIAWLLPLLLGPAIPAEESGSAALRYPASYRPVQLRADLEVARKAVLEAHGKLATEASRVAVARAFDALEAQLGSATSARQLYLGLCRLVSALLDGHTAVLPSREVVDYLYWRPTLLPFAWLIRGDGLFVRAAYRDEDSDLLGARVLSLAALPATEVIDDLAQLVPSDIDSPAARRAELEDALSFSLRFQLRYGPRTALSAVVRLADGATVTRSLQLVSRPDLRQLLAKTAVDPPPITLEPAPESGAAILTIDAFSGDDFEAQLRAAFEEVAGRGTKRLILDLRGNGGGDEALGSALVSYLLRERFRLYRRVSVRAPAYPSLALSNHPWVAYGAPGAQPAEGVAGLLLTPHAYPFLAWQAPRQPVFSGQLLVLIDAGTFSTASDVAAQLRSRQRAVFFGAETGGGYAGNTSGTTVTLTLPHTRVRLRIPLERFENEVTAAPGGASGVLPDHPLLVEPEDLHTGRDRVLEAVLAFADPPPR